MNSQPPKPPEPPDSITECGTCGYRAPTKEYNHTCWLGRAMMMAIVAGMIAYIVFLWSILPF